MRVAQCGGVPSQLCGCKYSHMNETNPIVAVPHALRFLLPPGANRAMSARLTPAASSFSMPTSSISADSFLSMFSVIGSHTARNMDLGGRLVDRLFGRDTRFHGLTPTPRLVPASLRVPGQAHSRGCCDSNSHLRLRQCSSAASNCRSTLRRSSGVTSRTPVCRPFSLADISATCVPHRRERETDVGSVCAL